MGKKELKIGNKQKTNKMIDLTPNLPIISLKINKHQLKDIVRKKCNHIMWCLQETHFVYNDTSKLKLKGGKNTYCENNQKKAGVAILLSDEVAFRAKRVITQR